jgi:hypothetical protein
MSDTIKKRLLELEALADEHPLQIPLAVAAKFLGVNPEGLKAALMRGNAPFGFGYQLTDGAYRVMVIPTVPFYLWYTNTRGAMVFHEEVAK